MGLAIYHEKILKPTDELRNIEDLGKFINQNSDKDVIILEPDEVNLSMHMLFDDFKDYVVKVPTKQYLFKEILEQNNIDSNYVIRSCLYTSSNYKEILDRYSNVEFHNLDENSSVIYILDVCSKTVILDANKIPTETIMKDALIVENLEMQWKGMCDEFYRVISRWYSNIGNNKYFIEDMIHEDVEREELLVITSNNVLDKIKHYACDDNEPINKWHLGDNEIVRISR